MTVGLSAAGANAGLDAILAAFPWVKLHTGDPGAAGTTNAATETTRKQATWAASSSGASSNTGALTWTAISGSQDPTHFSAWSASTAGTFGFSGTTTADPYVAGNDFTVAIGDLDVSLPVGAA